MPKVLRILNRLIVGGPVLNATYLTKYLSPEFETLLVVGEKESHEKSADYLAGQLGIDYITIPQMGRSINPVNDFQAFKELKRIIKEFKPDVVHTHAAKPGALGRLAASVCGVPAIVHTYHGHVFHSYFNSVKSSFYINAERFLARRSSAIVAISEAQRKELTEEFRIAPPEKFRVIQLGLDLDKFCEDQPFKRKKFREEFGLQDDEIAVGIIGRLVPVKNHELFLTAVAYVVKNTTKKIKAFVVGDGETRADLENKARALGLSFTTHRDTAHLHPLIFTSWRSDVDFVNAGLDIVTLTSLNEGTPVSLIEAQAANKPIVSTRVGGIADIVSEGETALLADVSDSETFCSHLLNLVNNEAIRQKLGNNNANYVLKRFSYQRLVKDTSDLYYELLHKKVTANAVLR
ncbi:glycosyltransferase [Flavisolibacter ginsenosidimutans]|uniref:Glycosyltransferase family 4 protein n=1 Tax=Flavisolibacter ginsenosidimutans TaxID=661481 RepID=A0A5B8UJY6_9BACT|nr:glycosyltransferase [Flavisolibacter ginsenosidimutans]QEC56469.1 glycosyltransferase family 4 protein [Flavisolibacter ginsenosidimutans]